jgi:hypothetical protein
MKPFRNQQKHKWNRLRIAASRQTALMAVAAGLAWILAAGGCGGPAAAGSKPETNIGVASKGRFTITLAQYDFEDRSENAQLLMQRAKAVLKTNEIWLDREPDRLSVNYGHFEKNMPDSPIQRELAKIKKIYKQLDAGPYQFCYIREVAESDPTAPREWNLLNQDCYYSLEIGTYFNVPEKEYYNRKADAVQAVKVLRESGDPAFFVHGRNESRVFIGCMPFNVSEPFIKLVLRKYPFRFENGAKVYNIRQNTEGQKVRLPVDSILIEVSLLKKELPF